MKKMVLLLAVLMPLAFASCAEEEKLDYSLAGTVWVSDDRSEIRFYKTTFTMNGGGGEYKYTPPKLNLIFSEDFDPPITIKCEINENILDLGEFGLHYKQ